MALLHQDLAALVVAYSETLQHQQQEASVHQLQQVSVVVALEHQPIKEQLEVLAHFLKQLKNQEDLEQQQESVVEVDSSAPLQAQDSEEQLVVLGHLNHHHSELLEAVASETQLQLQA